MGPYLCDVLSQVLEGRPIYVDCYGNLAPLTKGGQQLVLNFYAFKENRLPFCVKVLPSFSSSLLLPTTSFFSVNVDVEDS